MTEVTWAAGIGLRMARQARGLSQQQLASMAGVTRQAVSAIESGHSDPSLRSALALASALGLAVEEMFGPGRPADPVLARPVAPAEPGARVALANVGDTFVALPLRGETAARTGFGAAGGLVSARAGSGSANGTGDGTGDGTGSGSANGTGELFVRPISPPRPTLVVAGCDPALPLLETPLSLLDPPVAFAWWPCGSGEALRLAATGLVHAAGVHRPADESAPVDVAGLRGGAEVVGFACWREGLAARPGTSVTGLLDVARRGLRLVNREPGAQARVLLDQECLRRGLVPADLPGYDSQVFGHLQVAAAIAGGLADVGVSSEPAALAWGLDFVPLTTERFELVIPAALTGSREVQGLLKVLTSRWLLTQLASLPGYQPA